jgi:hypothetical protein
MGTRRGRFVEQPFLRLSPPAPETTAPQLIVSRSSPVHKFPRRPEPALRMRISDLLRRLASHFSSPRPSETKEKKPAPSNSSGTSLANAAPITSDKMPGTVNTPAAPSTSRFNAIPGPLGLASASLEGKVALVTGAGKQFFFLLLLLVCIRDGGVGAQRPIAAVWGLAGGVPLLSGGRHRRPGRVGRFTPTPSPAARPKAVPHTRYPQSRRAPFGALMEIELAVGCSQSQALHSQHQMNPPSKHHHHPHHWRQARHHG